MMPEFQSPSVFPESEMPSILPEAALPAFQPLKLEPKFLTKLAKALGQIHRVPKRGRNDYQKYDYATEADILAAVRGPLADNGLALFCYMADKRQVHWNVGAGKPLQFKTIVTLIFTLCDTETGESIALPFQGEGIDNLDKGLPKAITAATKYFLKTTFLIATGDDPEADTALDALADSRSSATRSAASPKSSRTTAAPASSSKATSSAPAPSAAPPAEAPDPAPDAGKPATLLDAPPTQEQLNALATFMKAHHISKEKLYPLIHSKFGWPITNIRELNADQMDLLLEWLDQHYKEAS
ncbi:ERF family protein [Sulfobacillus thermosulfidooxidans]|nr:ERF family protein [Sulfobacillus thermosulfidooxidans]